MRMSHNLFIFRAASVLGVKKDLLLLNHIRPYKAVSVDTVSRSTYQMLGLSGIYNYTGHSTRAASTSKVDAKGLSIEKLLEQGHWSRKSTFQKFYRKEIWTIFKNNSCRVPKLSKLETEEFDV